MSNTIRFQKEHSRNSHEWGYVEEGGRHFLSANGNGVKKRLGLLMNRIGKDTKVHRVRDLLDSLQDLHSGYSRKDVVHGMNRLVDVGCARKVKGGYTVTPKGVQLWQSSKKVFV